MSGVISAYPDAYAGGSFENSELRISIDSRPRRDDECNASKSIIGVTNSSVASTAGLPKPGDAKPEFV